MPISICPKNPYVRRVFVELPIFRTRWRAIGLDDNDLVRLQEELLSDPKVGAVLKGSGGVRKMRFAFQHRGKSGSIRVIYVEFEVYEKIFLITAYTKEEKDNLIDAERAEIKHLIKVLEQQLEDSE